MSNSSTAELVVCQELLLLLFLLLLVWSHHQTKATSWRNAATHAVWKELLVSREEASERLVQNALGGL